MIDLIERLREVARDEDERVRLVIMASGLEPILYTGSKTGELMREAAAALEAAREDAAMLDWLASEARMLSGWRDSGRWEMPAIQIDSTREQCTPIDMRAAIDQARGKGCGAGKGEAS